MGVIKSFFGGAPKAKAKPIQAAQPVASVTDAQKDTAKKARQQLYSTEGGAVGQELNPSQVKKRETLLGN
jgi:hypothetical protein